MLVPVVGLIKFVVQTVHFHLLFWRTSSNSNQLSGIKSPLGHFRLAVWRKIYYLVQMLLALKENISVRCKLYSCFSSWTRIKQNYSQNITLPHFTNWNQQYITLLIRLPARTNQFFSRHVRKIMKSDYCFIMSVWSPAWNNSIPTGWILMKFDI